jgi:CO/xanthine dehydrogenase Mo-binding subunit
MSFRDEIEDLLASDVDLDAGDRAFLTAWAASTDTAIINWQGGGGNPSVVQYAIRDRRIALMEGSRAAVVKRNEANADKRARLLELAQASKEAAALLREVQARQEFLFDTDEDGGPLLLGHVSDDLVRAYERGAMSLKAAAGLERLAHVDPRHQGGNGWARNIFISRMIDTVTAVLVDQNGDVPADTKQDRELVAAVANLIFNEGLTAIDVTRALNKHRGTSHTRTQNSA